MKIAILETVVPSGHEVEYDRGLVKEIFLKGHTPLFLVPENYPFKSEYGAQIEYLKGGEAISYSKAGFLKKVFLSVLREIRRRCWFKSACELAEAKDCSLIVIPTATPRYLKAVLGSALRNSKVPVVVNLQVFSFEKKGRLEQFLKLASALAPYKNIHITITSPNHALSNLPNVSYLDPPFYEPSLIKSKGPYDGHKPLILGLYGFYRHDENLRKLFHILATAEFKTPFKLVMQAVTNNEKDEESCRELISLYGDNPRFSFTKDYLKDESWQRALDNADVILAPYNSKQYLYTYSAMCFNALGFRKPVILSPNVNPDVMKDFEVGLCLDFSDDEVLKNRVVEFIDTFDERYSHYLAEIERASERYSFENTLKELINLAL